jgi:hypothetical protein
VGNSHIKHRRSLCALGTPRIGSISQHLCEVSIEICSSLVVGFFTFRLSVNNEIIGFLVIIVNSPGRNGGLWVILFFLVNVGCTAFTFAIVFVVTRALVASYLNSVMMT